MKLILFLFLVLSASLGQPPVNPHSAILLDFDQRVTEYVKFRKTIEAKLPKLKSTPAQSKIVAHQDDLGGIIRGDRLKTPFKSAPKKTHRERPASPS